MGLVDSCHGSFRDEDKRKHIMRLSTGSSREPIYEVDDRALSINIVQHATPPLG